LPNVRHVTRRLLVLAGAVAGVAALRERRLRNRAERFAAAALESLLRAIDANDPQTGAHVRRVADYSLILADALEVSDDERRTIELTALFHDIGKIHEALFDIVHEPRKLTAAERRAIHTHPDRGAEVLAPISNFHPKLGAAVLAHHERWDGSGYPRGTRGRRIPLAARVVMIADTFDAITQRRRYRTKRSIDDAARIIQDGSGTQFDPDLVALMMDPDVLQRIAQACLRNAKKKSATSFPMRPVRGAEGGMPDVDMRWRSRSEAPRELHVGTARSSASR
jgi:HD-GYP domain-containing protein (c-di-GMP phosphodiesterase class II)